MPQQLLTVHAQFRTDQYEVLGPLQRPENGLACWLLVGFIRSMRCCVAKNGVSVHGDWLALVGTACDNRIRSNTRLYFWLFVAH